MQLTFPNITQKEFQHAFDNLAVCTRPNAPDYGFNHPYFTPGGGYTNTWWQLDSSLALTGYKWQDRKFAETCLLNFIESQKPDGRICLWGKDKLPEVESDRFSKQREGVSSLPKLFDAAYNILLGTTDADLIENTYGMLKKYLDWWYNDRFDKETGLITAVFEETFVPYLGSAMEYTPVDTNVEVYVGLIYTAEIARWLNKTDDAADLQARAEALKNAINSVLWWEEKGAYYPYDLLTKKHVDFLMASTFNPLRMGIATPQQKEKLLSLMQDDEHFNWNTIPLTSVSKKDPQFVVHTGVYQGNPSWSGSVWTMINEMVIRGLLDCGEKDLAAELTLKTLYTFNNNCQEFVHPFDGTGHGVVQYAWSSSQYIQLFVEVIFGIRSDARRKEVSISPNLPDALKNETISIADVMVFDGVYLDVTVEKGRVRYNISDNSITVKA